MILRRNAFPILTVLALAFALPGCPKKTDDAASDDDKGKKKDKKDKDDDKGKKKKSKDDDDKEASDDDKGKKKKSKDDDDKEASDDDKGKKKKSKDDDDDKGKKKKDDDDAPSGKGPFAANIEGQALEFKFGRATVGFGDMQITLSTEKLGCSDSPSDDAWQVSFELYPGPDGKFYAGGKDPVGVTVYINSQRLKLKSSFVQPYIALADVESFKLAEGEHIKGKLDFDNKYQDYTTKKDFKYAGHGNFDVTICKDWSGFKNLEGQPADADSGDVAGEFNAHKFKYKKALVSVQHDTSNDVDYVDEVDFFQNDKVTCANRYDTKNAEDYFMVRTIGGAGGASPVTGSPQPADPMFSIPEQKPGDKKPFGSWKMFGGGSHRAWVKFDKLKFGAGDTVTGTVYADSAKGQKPDQTGKISGTFTGTVCKGFF